MKMSTPLNKPVKVLLKEIKDKTATFLENKKNANNLIDIISKAEVRLMFLKTILYYKVCSVSDNHHNVLITGASLRSVCTDSLAGVELPGT